MSQRCRSCAFWDWSSLNPEAESLRDIGEEHFGYCRRHAPRPLVIVNTEGSEQTRTDTLWPETPPSSWCGDYQEEENNTEAPTDIEESFEEEQVAEEVQET